MNSCYQLWCLPKWGANNSLLSTIKIVEFKKDINMPINFDKLKSFQQLIRKRSLILITKTEQVLVSWLPVFFKWWSFTAAISIARFYTNRRFWYRILLNWTIMRLLIIKLWIWRPTIDNSITFFLCFQLDMKLLDGHKSSSILITDSDHSWP